MAMANSMMAMQPQAKAWIKATYDALDAAGLGFKPEDLEAIKESAAAHPYPEGYESGQATAADIAAAQDLAQRSLSAVYPPNGFDPADPRLAPVEGVTLALNAIAARAIGWNTDEAYNRRIVVDCLGFDQEVWDRAVLVLRERLQADAVLAAFYGQLYAAA